MVTDVYSPILDDDRKKNEGDTIVMKEILIRGLLRSISDKFQWIRGEWKLYNRIKIFAITNIFMVIEKRLCYTNSTRGNCNSSL